LLVWTTLILLSVTGTVSNAILFHSLSLSLSFGHLFFGVFVLPASCAHKFECEFLVLFLFSCLQHELVVVMDSVLQVCPNI